MWEVSQNVAMQKYHHYVFGKNHNKEHYCEEEQLLKHDLQIQWKLYLGR